MMQEMWARVRRRCLRLRQSIRRRVGVTRDIERHDDFGPEKRLILLIPGFGATRRVFRIMEKRMRQDGFSVVSLRLPGLLYELHLGRVSTLARMIHEKLERICERHGVERISIIAHSKGGLVARYYINEFDEQRRVDALITLATPHRINLRYLFASALKGIWGLGNLATLLPLVRDAASTLYPRSVRVVSIYSRDDRICPSEFCEIPVPKDQETIHLKNIEITGISHTGFLFKKQVYEIVRRELHAGHSLSVV
ncbi:MAG: alpha/beta fold hydrolase [Deltaproteobacteria bacterium]|nr:MAG: alpha/beta fold hydrolase [Deltaproteobacteria bacterium]